MTSLSLLAGRIVQMNNIFPHNINNTAFPRFDNQKLVTQEKYGQTKWSKIRMQSGLGLYLLPFFHKLFVDNYDGLNLIINWEGGGRKLKKTACVLLL